MIAGGAIREAHGRRRPMLALVPFLLLAIPDSAGAAPVHVDDERHATGVVFEGGIIQALRPRGDAHAPSSSWWSVTCLRGRRWPWLGGSKR